MIASCIFDKFKEPETPYKYETPNKNTPDEIAEVRRYLKAASFE